MPEKSCIKAVFASAVSSPTTNSAVVAWQARRRAGTEAARMSEVDRRIDWIMWQGGFAAALYVGIVEEVDWVHYALAAFICWTLISYASTLLNWIAPRRIEFPPVPQAAVMAFDLGVLASMFLAHWYWTAFAYAAACGCLALLHARTASKP